MHVRVCTCVCMCVIWSLRVAFQFVRSELGHPEGTEKSHMLHHNDLFITFEELWEAWQKSEGTLVD